VFLLSQRFCVAGLQFPQRSIISSLGVPDVACTAFARYELVFATSGIAVAMKTGHASETGMPVDDVGVSKLPLDGPRQAGGYRVGLGVCEVGRGLTGWLHGTSASTFWFRLFVCDRNITVRSTRRLKRKRNVVAICSDRQRRTLRYIQRRILAYSAKQRPHGPQNVEQQRHIF